MERKRLQHVERAAGLWSPADRAEILSDFAAEVEARLRARGRGAKPPSHIAEDRAEWAQVTRWIDAVFKTAPATAAPRTAYVGDALQTIWRDFLGQPKPASAAVINRVLVGRGPRNMAFRLLEAKHRWSERELENVRRALRRGMP